MDSQTMAIPHFVIFSLMMSQIKHWKHYKAPLISYDVTTQKFANLLDVRSLACRIKVLNSCVPGI